MIDVSFVILREEKNYVEYLVLVVPVARLRNSPQEQIFRHINVPQSHYSAPGFPIQIQIPNNSECIHCTIFRDSYSNSNYK